MMYNMITNLKEFLERNYLTEHLHTYTKMGQLQLILVPTQGGPLQWFTCPREEYKHLCSCYTCF